MARSYSLAQGSVCMTSGCAAIASIARPSATFVRLACGVLSAVRLGLNIFALLRVILSSPLTKVMLRLLLLKVIN